MLKSLSDKVADLHVCSFIKKETATQMFQPVNMAKFSRKPFLKNICKRLLLNIEIHIYHDKYISLV